MSRRHVHSAGSLFFLAANLLFLSLSFTAHGQGLNDLFSLPIWKDSNLWDDQAWATAQRLKLKSTQSRQGNETYRAGIQGRQRVMGQKLYAIDLYPKDSKTSRIVLGFASEADVAEYEPTRLARYQEYRNEVFDGLRIALTQRLNRPSGEGDSLYWSWVNHTLHLQNSEKAVLITILPGAYRPNASAESRVISDERRAATPPERYVKRSSNGDVIISGIPKISQGNRGYCVPATWEKLLRHYGLGFNVYDLAVEGDTAITGSTFTRFTGRMSSMLKPHQYQVKYLRFYPEDINSVAGYIDQGLPLIWHMNSQFLREWVRRNSSRRGSLPDSPIYANPSGPIQGHALLIIGYNKQHGELALSDSTELGSSLDAIWIHGEEAAATHQRRTELLAILPPNRSGGKRDFLKAKWY